MNAATPDLFESAHVLAVQDAPLVDAEALLNRAIASSSRKSALKALDDSTRQRLAQAFATVALHKLAAYQRAVSGEMLSAHGWLKSQPALAEAVALLNQHFLDEVPLLEANP